MQENLSIPIFCTAILAVDCQTVFADAACQGNQDTQEAARKLAEELPRLRNRGIALYSIFAKAGKAKDAGLLPCVAGGIPFPKGHESAFVNSVLSNRLRHNSTTTLLVVGFHLATCVTATAVNGAQRGYRVIVPTDLCGEGDRGRNLSGDQLNERKESAYQTMRNHGVILTQSGLIL